MDKKLSTNYLSFPPLEIILILDLFSCSKSAKLVD